MTFGFIGIGPTEVIVILVIALLVFGPQKLPEIGKQIGSAYREMNRMRNEVTRALEFDSYSQPYDMPTYESPTPGTTYAHGNYDYSADNYQHDNDEIPSLQTPPPGPRFGQENVTLLSAPDFIGEDGGTTTGGTTTAGNTASETPESGSGGTVFTVMEAETAEETVSSELRQENVTRDEPGVEIAVGAETARV